MAAGQQQHQRRPSKVQRSFGESTSSDDHAYVSPSTCDSPGVSSMPSGPISEDPWHEVCKSTLSFEDVLLQICSHIVVFIKAFGNAFPADELWSSRSLKLAGEAMNQ